MSVNVLFQVSSDSDAKLVEMCKRFMEKPVEDKGRDQRTQKSPQTAIKV